MEASRSFARRHVGEWDTGRLAGCLPVGSLAERPARAPGIEKLRSLLGWQNDRLFVGVGVGAGAEPRTRFAWGRRLSLTLGTSTDETSGRRQRRRVLACVGCVLLTVTAALPSVALAATTRARVEITPGGLTLSTPSIAIVGLNPLQLAVEASVTDARGSGAGWSLSMTGQARGRAGASSVVVAGASTACLPGSSCALPVNYLDYPAAVSLTGVSSTVFEAEPASGLGAQSIRLDLIAVEPPQALSLSLSISSGP